MKTAIVHIGAHKTGSTSIQAALVRTKPDLRDQGILYFNDYNRKVQLLTLGLKGDQRKKPILKSKYATLEEAMAASRSTWWGLARTVRKSDSSFTVISEEALMRIRTPEKLARLLNRIFDRVVIVAYVRNPVDRLPSSVDQKVRQGVNTQALTKGKFLVPPFIPKLNLFAEAFGKEAMIVRNFDRRNMVAGSPVSDFSHVLSVVADREVSLHDAGHVNESLPGSVTSVLLRENDFRKRNRMQRTRIWVKQRGELIDELRRCELLKGGPKLRLEDTPLLAHVQSTHDVDVDRLNSLYLADQMPISLGGQGLRLAPQEVQPAFRSWIDSYSEPHIDELVAMLRGMVSRPRYPFSVG